MIAMEAGSQEIVNRLVDCSRIDVNIVSSEGKSALILACEKNCLPVVELLIKVGAVVNNLKQVSLIRFD